VCVPIGSHVDSNPPTKLKVDLCEGIWDSHHGTSVNNLVADPRLPELPVPATTPARDTAVAVMIRSPLR
jgi:hypothetical protein